MRFFETEEFKRLQREWYAKLRQSSFEDQEKFIADEPVLFHPSKRALGEHTYDEAMETRDYFVLLAQMVAVAEFESTRDQMILEMRSEGWQIGQIAEQLKLFGFGCHRQTVRFVIRKFEHKWQIRKWQKMQMTSNRPATGS